MPARMEFNFDLGRKEAPRDGARANGGPMRLLVLGDFSGRAVADRPPLASRPTHRIDVDNLDDTLRRLAPRVTLPAGELRFEEMEDFHPDALYARFELFDALRQARAQPPASGGDLLGSLLGPERALRQRRPARGRRQASMPSSTASSRRTSCPTPRRRPRATPAPSMPPSPSRCASCCTNPRSSISKPLGAACSG